MTPSYTRRAPAPQGFGGQAFGTLSAPIPPPVIGEIPKHEQDRSSVEFRYHIITAKKDGKLWIKVETVMTDWKPLKYFEAMVAGQAQRQAEQLVRRSS